MHLQGVTSGVETRVIAVDGLCIADPTNATEPFNVRVYAVLNGS